MSNMDQSLADAMGIPVSEFRVLKRKIKDKVYPVWIDPVSFAQYIVIDNVKYTLEFVLDVKMMPEEDTIEYAYNRAMKGIR